MKKEKLSNRIRPNSEVLPWIYEEIKILEKQNEAMREAIKEAHTSFERCKADRGERDKVLIVTNAALAKLQPFLNK
ncbi:MAG: hypothetical protein FMNOHCHN_01616 [Ignavibacteriaceae bacterium]|nr:hypothetical protein [Ignavibacteriaceae bacterium]